MTASPPGKKPLPSSCPGFWRAVVLLHSTSKTNAAILDELLTKWEEMGYRFDSVEALFSEPRTHWGLRNTME